MPADALRAGLNEIQIVNTGLSWILYDWIGFEAPPDAQLVPAQGARLRSVKLDPWLSRQAGALSQELQATCTVIGDGQDLALRVTGLPERRFRPRDSEQTLVSRLPPVQAPTPIIVKLQHGPTTLDQRELLQEPAREREPVDYVDCLLGTSSSRWMLYPGPCLPFGMVKLSPDNQKQGWMAGYEYAIENIAGFSHIHSWTMGGLLTMAITGELRTLPGTEQDPDAGYRSRFRHETETAAPGFYAVTLDDYKIRAELTCTTRAGFQRYTFPKAGQAWILFDLETETEYGYDVLEAQIRKVSDREIEGYAVQRGRTWATWNDYTVHFVARVSRPFGSMGGWVGSDVRRGITEISGKGDLGCFLGYHTEEGEAIQLQTGISLVSIEQARLNLETEMAPFGWDFEGCRRQARRTWSDLLGAIEIEGGTETDKVKFFTNLYRSYCARTIWSDVNGRYRDMYEKVQQLPDPDSPVYGCDAFWNTFWNLNQLWVLVHPDIANKWVRSLLEIYDRGGWLSKGPTGIEYSSIMVASHEIALIVAAHQAGIRNYDVAKAYLFNHAGAPWLTQKWAREIMDHYYGTGPADGYPGDEDQGQMGAWLVMSAMGLFQLDGGCATRPIYEIGSPLFDRVVIHLDPPYYPGGQFVIETRNNSKTNVYIQSATLDGRPLTRPWFPQAELLDGGRLVLEMGPEPNRDWGRL